MVYRVFVEKKPSLAAEAKSLLSDLNNLLSITSIKSLRVVNRYDVEGIDADLFKTAKSNIFSEPQLDDTSESLDLKGGKCFAVEPLPGQFDQRADSAAQCIQIVSQNEKPLVNSAKVYVYTGDVSDDDTKQFKSYVINPVECREASPEKPQTLKVEYKIPTTVETLKGFINLDQVGLAAFVKKYSLAMDEADIAFCRDYFISERRDPTITEIRMIDTYWSDHCRHTTFLTTIDKVSFEDKNAQKTYEEYLSDRAFLGRENKPINLMDVATVGAKVLKKQGKLPNLDESDEINACTVKIKVNVDGKDEDWLLLFKNETHNHPTEIEPFGGAATCLGGAIRDPLSGRAYVYAAMRVTGAGDPLVPISETIKGKLSQRKIVTTAAAGYSSYGNQIGLATGMVNEIYHPGYVAKRMEIGAVIGAAPQSSVRREEPISGDVVILLGGKTGRDGCGGATGSSKAHSASSLTTCGSEVQKGNAPEERKIQRLFRNSEVSLLIKRCNDFGAGGVSVAIGELADGLEINLNAVPKKYDGLDGTELAISESQERMAVVVAKEDAEKFISLANEENLEATPVAVVTEEKRLKMKWNGRIIVDVSREFLNSNGAVKHTVAAVKQPKMKDKTHVSDFCSGLLSLANNLNTCLGRGLWEHFDSTIGAGTVLMPFGGKYQNTPIQTMVHKVSVEKGDTDTCSLMSWAFNPYLSERDCFLGGYRAVVESVAKLIAAGAPYKDIYLTFQEYFEKPNNVPERWGKPLAALLGAYRAEKDLGLAAIGGKDSMSGTFEHIDVPPTLVSFAVTTAKLSDIITPEFKKVGNKVYLIKPESGADGLVNTEDLLSKFNAIYELKNQGIIKAVYVAGFNGVADCILKMSFGNRYGFKFDDNVSLDTLFGDMGIAFVVEADKSIDGAKCLGMITADLAFCLGAEKMNYEEVFSQYENKLESVYPCNVKSQNSDVIPSLFKGREGEKSEPKHASIRVAKPRFLIPVFPGTNCEYDSAKAIARAGGEAEIFVVKNLSADALNKSVNEFANKIKSSQAVFIPGGFSGGDEPDGSAKFITAFFRNNTVKDAVHDLIKNRDGLMAGICNGFQALIKLGLLTYGEIVETKPDEPTLTFNTIARHQSMIVRTAVTSVKSPWLNKMSVGDIVNVPVSHGEGRFLCNAEWLKKLQVNGQIFSQYVDTDGNATSSVRFNPNDSVWAIEGITSPDGKVLGKMGHSERTGKGLYLNMPGNYDTKLFDSAVEYFK